MIKNDRFAWRYLDFSSVVPHIFIEGQSRFFSAIGVAFSILAAFSTGALGIYFLYIFFRGRDLTVIYMRETKNFNPFIDLNYKLFMFRFTDANEIPIDPRIAVIYPTYWKSENGTMTVKALKTESCSFEKHLPDLKYRQMLQFDISKFQCFDPDQSSLLLYEDKNTDNYTYFNIYITECVNSTENNSTCYARDQIISTLRRINMYFQYYLETSILDHYNQNYPVQSSFYTNFQKIFYDFSYSHYHSFNNLIYSSDEGSVIEDITNYDSFLFDDLTKTSVIAPQGTKNYAKNSIATFQFTINTSFADKYIRAYPKLQSVVANIGGIMKFISTVTQFLSSNITNSMMYVYLSNFLFSLPKKDIKENPNNLQIIDGLSVSKYSNSNVIGLNYHHNNSSFGKENRLSQISWIESTLPRACAKTGSLRKISDKLEKLIKKKLSCEEFLTDFYEMHKLKKILFDSNQIEAFNLIPYPQFKENSKTELPVNRSKTTGDIIQELSFNEGVIKVNRRIMMLLREQS